jgi:DNA topoisomerase-3
MSADEQALYDLIVRHYLAQFLGNYQYQVRQVTVSCCGETFRASSNTPVFAGWKRAITSGPEDDSKEDSDDAPLSLIPALTLNEVVVACNQRIEPKKTRPPSHFTEGTLIDAMKHIGKWVTEPELKKILKETAGIGTEATRASIIELLIKRDYLVRKGKQLQSTEKGQQLIDTLPATVKEPALTARWEQALDEVAQGQLTVATFLSQQAEHLRDSLQAIRDAAATLVPAKSTSAGAPSATLPCPVCQQPLVRRKGTKGYFWGCSHYPACRGSLPDEKEKPAKPNKKTTTTGGVTLACPQCTTGYLVNRSGSRGPFWGCSQFPACRATYRDQKGKPWL